SRTDDDWTRSGIGRGGGRLCELRQGSLQLGQDVPGARRYVRHHHEDVHVYGLDEERCGHLSLARRLLRHRGGCLRDRSRVGEPDVSESRFARFGLICLLFVFSLVAHHSLTEAAEHGQPSKPPPPGSTTTLATPPASLVIPVAEVATRAAQVPDLIRVLTEPLASDDQLAAIRRRLHVGQARMESVAAARQQEVGSRPAYPRRDAVAAAALVTPTAPGRRLADDSHSQSDADPGQPDPAGRDAGDVAADAASRRGIERAGSDPRSDRRG